MAGSVRGPAKTRAGPVARDRIYMQMYVRIGISFLKSDESFWIISSISHYYFPGENVEEQNIENIVRQEEFAPQINIEGNNLYNIL